MGGHGSGRAGPAWKPPVPPSGLGQAVLALWASVSSPVDGGGGDPLLGARERGSMLGVGLEAVIVTHPERGVWEL